MTLDQAITAAIELNKKVEEPDIKTGFEALDDAMITLENEGVPVSILVPRGQESSLR